MGEWIRELFVSIFGAHSEIATILISMIPIVELRGAIPFGAAKSFWGENALSLWESFAYSVLGSTLVCVILTFLFWPIFKWLKRTKWFKKLADFIERKLHKNSANIDKKADEEKNEKRVWWIKFLGVFAFVAIPLPLTGVWTGTCLALFIGLSKKDTMISVISGNLVAGLLMTLISHFFADNTMIVLLAFLGLVVVFVLYEVVKSLIKKARAKKNGETTPAQKEALASEAETEVDANLSREIEEGETEENSKVLSQIENSEKIEEK